MRQLEGDTIQGGRKRGRVLQADVSELKAGHERVTSVNQMVWHGNSYLHPKK